MKVPKKAPATAGIIILTSLIKLIMTKLEIREAIAE